MFLNIAMQLHNLFYKMIALGLGTCYIFQVFLTIGGATKFIPSTGVTLPLVSYGGSSLISTLIMFAIIQGLYLSLIHICLGILSALGPDDLRFAVASNDVKAIQAAPGIGKKTAEKLILELKDKLNLEDALENTVNAVQNTADTSAGMANEMTGEAVQALVALGYGNTEALKAVRQVEITEEMSVEDVLRQSLKYML